MGALAGEAVVGATVKSVIYRNVFYNVVGTGMLKNNTFYFSLNGVLKQFDIPEGFYYIDDLRPVVLAGIQTILNLQAAPVQTAAMTYSPVTGKITLTVTDNGNGDTVQLMGASFPDSINTSIGNTVDVVINTSPVAHVFKDIINIAGEDACQLVIDEIAKGSGLSNSSTNNFGSTSGMLCLLSYKGAGFGSLADYHNPDPIGTMLLYANPQNLSNLSVSLQTASGIILDLQSSDLHIELLLYLR
jgi:hypothetical protein